MFGNAGCGSRGSLEACVGIQRNNFDGSLGFIGEGLGEGGGGGSCGGGGGGGAVRGSIEGVLEGAFDELAAMDFHGGEGAEVAGKIVGGEVLGFLDGLALEEFGGHGGDGDGGLAAEGLEGGAVDDLLAVLLSELQPHAEHIPAIDGAGRADGIGVRHFPEVAGIGDGLAGAFFEVI